MDELIEAIDEVIEWLDFDVWDGNPELEKSVRKLKHERLKQILAEQKMKVNDVYL